GADGVPELERLDFHAHARQRKGQVAEDRFGPFDEATILLENYRAAGLPVGDAVDGVDVAFDAALVAGDFANLEAGLRGKERGGGADILDRFVRVEQIGVVHETSRRTGQGWERGPRAAGCGSWRVRLAPIIGSPRRPVKWQRAPAAGPLHKRPRLFYDCLHRRAWVVWPAAGARPPG